MSKVQLAGNASGTGIFTIASPNSNTDRTLTLPDNTGTLVTTASTGSVTQAMLASNVAGNGPAFSVNRTGNQTVSSGVWTKIQFNAEEFDTANAFDSTTNYRFQPTVAGYYFVQLTMSCLSNTFQACLVSIYKNGSNWKNCSNYASASGTLDDWTASASSLIYLNGSTDYLEGYGFSLGASPEFAGYSNYTYFSGYLARTA